MPPVAITIDTEFPDQPARDPLGALHEMLDLLAARTVKATFFIVGAWVRAHPDHVLAIKDAAHHIGNHSYSHCVLSRMTEAGIVADLTACHEVLAELGIETRPWFRAPQGELIHEQIDVKAAIKKAGYRHVHWHAVGQDWSPEATPEGVAESIVRGVQDRWPRPAIALLHSWPDSAPRALQLVLDRLEAEGSTFLTLNQLDWRQEVAGRVREVTAKRRSS